MRLYTLLKKDGKVILRSRLLLVTLIVYPLIIVGIIGYAFSQPNTRIPIAVLNQDLDEDGEPEVGFIKNPVDPDAQGIEVSTDQIIRGIPGDEVPGLVDFTEVSFVGTEDEGRDLLLAGEVQALIIFPSGFVDALTSYVEPATIRVIVDQSDVVRSNVTEIMIRGIVQQLQERFVEQKVDFVIDAIDEAMSPPLSSSLYPGFGRSITRLTAIRDQAHENRTLPGSQMNQLNETIRFLERVVDVLEDSRGIVESVAQPVTVQPEGEKSGHLFIRDLVIPAALGLSIFWTGSLATSSLIVYEREGFAYRRLGITPTTRATIVGSKVVLTSLIILVQSLFILIAALVAWDARIDNIPLTVLLVIMSTFASIGLGIFLSGISRDVNGTILLAVLVTFPMLFLSGLFYPVSFMPEGAQFLARLFPLTYTVEGLRGSMLRGFGFLDGLGHVVALLLFGLLLTLVGTFLGRMAEKRTA